MDNKNLSRREFSGYIGKAGLLSIAGLAIIKNANASIMEETPVFDRDHHIIAIMALLRLNICDEKIRLAHFGDLNLDDWRDMLQESFAELRATGWTYAPGNCINKIKTLCQLQA